MTEPQITRAILALIAAGIWLNLLIGQIRAVSYQDRNESYFNSIEVDLDKISRGECYNKKLC